MIERARRASPNGMTGEQIVEGFERAAKRMEPSRERIVYSREVEDGVVALTSERAFDAGRFDRDPLIPRLPQRTTLTRAAANRLSGERPYCSRRAHGGSLRAKAAADEAERWLNAALELTYDYDASVGLALEGEFATVVLPSPADYRRVPDLLDLYLQLSGSDVNPPVVRQIQLRTGITIEDRETTRYVVDLGQPSSLPNAAVDASDQIATWRALKRMPRQGPVRFVNELNDEVLARFEQGVRRFPRDYRVSGMNTVQQHIVAEFSITEIPTSPADLGLDVGPIEAAPVAAGGDGFKYGAGVPWGSGKKWT